MPEPRIWILPTEVAERIAAGEVVERPASVVKELVENALDAGAKRVSVETQAGGKALIRVTDDGCGMTPAEARLALHRHATSKLRGADDLFNIHTLGFRGEALPSIAAVSHLEILTRTPDEPGGTRIRVEGGVVTAEEPAAAAVGTTISVERLFYNVPVREKFLRAESTEATQITEWLQRLALSRPDVSFRLTHDRREALLSPGSQDPLNAVVAVLGRPVARDLLRVGPSPEVAPAEGEVRVSGFVGRPTLTRANRGLQHFYVNGRAVRSPLFFRALDDAFRASMPSGRHPAAVLFIQVPPGEVDVNVHPAKTEVRFQDEKAVQRAITQAVLGALRSAGAPAETGTLLEASAYEAPMPPPSLRVAEPAAPPAEPAAPGELPFAERAIGGPPPPWERRYSAPGPSRRETEESGQTSSRSASAGDFDPFAGDAEDAAPRISWPSRPPVPAREPAEAWRPAAAEPPSAPAAAAPRPEVEEAPSLEALTLLGQAQELFILAEGGGKLWVIDQHVAHERVLFDRLTAPGAAAEPAEPLLLPATLDLDRTRALALEEHAELLAELGFVVEPFGAARFRLRAVPRSLLGRDYAAAFRDLVDELAEQSHGGQVRLQKEQVAAAAAGRSCKRAIKAGQRLSTAEMERLLEELRRARNPYTCPHGRPVFLTWEEDEVAALFGDATCD
ncbi:MAG: DNA mismatch repair endonuclease MutL [Armatimonadota bacterium]